jgi:hypothetical protein
MTLKDILLYWITPSIVGVAIGMLSCQIIINKILGE